MMVGHLPDVPVQHQVPLKSETQHLDQSKLVCEPQPH